jgi:hypothetical protein
MLKYRTGVSVRVTSTALISLTRAAQNSAYAANFTVSSTSDISGTKPGDDLCATIFGSCTLRADSIATIFGITSTC